MRSAKRSRSSWPHAPVHLVRGVAAGLRPAAGRGCRPRTTRCRRASGWGRSIVIWPVSRNGRSGTTPDDTCARVWVISSTESATCTVPGARSGRLVHGTGPESAQSTLTVPGSSSKSRMPRTTRAGRCSSATSRPKRWVADTSASTARVAYDCAVAGAYAGHAAVADVDGRHLGVGHQLRAAGGAAGDERVGELLGAAAGDGEADRLAEHRHQHAEDPRAGRGEREVGVAGVAVEQQPRRPGRRRARGRARRPGSPAAGRCRGRRPGPAPAPAGRPRAPAGRAR